MTAFLFIPATHDARLAQRVDFSNIAAMFAEAEEPAALSSPLKGQAWRVAAAMLILLAFVGDTILLAKPKMLATAIDATHQAALALARNGA